MSVPFEERGGPIRGCLDLLSGRYPRFIFGGRVGADLLPAFHFHDVTRDDLEPKLRFLAENGYQTVTADEMAAFARREQSFNGSPRVALCFDDAWASLWTVAAPLLKHYGLTAITYAIPARIEDASSCRPTHLESAGSQDDPPLVTWPELRALHASGVVDVQCHTESHSMIFSSGTLAGFVTPAYARLPMLNRPQLSPLPDLRFLEPDRLGAPLYEARSRMSAARRFDVPLDVQDRCVGFVAQAGPAFFERPEWFDELRRVAGDGAGREAETESERERAVESELDRGRSILNARLNTTTVRHVCLPWGVSSDTTVSGLARLGYRSAIANRMQGTLAVRSGADPYWLKRLPNRYIFSLPGRGRRTWI